MRVPCPWPAVPGSSRDESAVLWSRGTGGEKCRKGCPQFRPQAPSEATLLPVRGRVVRSRWLYRVLTFLTVFGPGLIVMEAETTRGRSPPTCRRALSTAPGCFEFSCCCCCCRFRTYSGDGGTPRNRHRQGSRRHDLPALRSLVGNVLARRSATGEFPDAGHGVCRDFVGLEPHEHRPAGGSSTRRSCSCGHGGERQLPALGFFIT